MLRRSEPFRSAGVLEVVMPFGVHGSMKYLILFLPLVTLGHCKGRDADEPAMLPDTERVSAASSTKLLQSSASPVALPAAPATGFASAPKATAEPGFCEVMCGHTRALGCTALSECSASCTALLADQQCHDQLIHALSCMIAEPRTHWVCGEDGLAAIDSGYCDAEQRAFVGCVQQAS
ncbi:MAG TPA: hypothetical protein VFQ61_09945 [Polyangiaceae bacterium]|nr:hypothetical protein [Polyangiaceae bacterium]